MKYHGNKKDFVNFLSESIFFKKILGNYELSDEEKKQVMDFFTTYDDGDRSGIWRKNICIWIQNNLADWVNRRELLSKCKSNSFQWFILMYGDNAQQKFEEQRDRLKKSLPSTIEYWANKGFDPDTAKQKVSDRQKEISSNKIFDRKMSVRCEEFWLSKGYDTTEAKKIISNLQKRDLDFFICKYGEIEGKNRFEGIKKSKKATWENKNKIDHGKKTAPKKFNPNGQEMKAIYGFIDANNIPIRNCKYGSPKDQFWQYIPNLGYRRYDLAVFSDQHHTKLVYILEFHGPGHINFSDYRPELENELITINGKILSHFGTYGSVYHNDFMKRQHILNKFIDVKYIVLWTEDLISKRFKIDELLQKRK